MLLQPQPGVLGNPAAHHVTSSRVRQAAAGWEAAAAQGGSGPGRQRLIVQASAGKTI